MEKTVVKEIVISECDCGIIAANGAEAEGGCFGGFSGSKCTCGE